MPTIYIVEDDPTTRAALAERIAARSELLVTATVGTVKEALIELQRGAPDVLLVDLGLPDGSGLEVIRKAAEQYPQLNILVLTIFGDERNVVAALKAGASGYLLKDDSSQEIGHAITQLLAGGSPISAAIARHMIEHFRSRELVSEQINHSVRLTEREREVLALAAKGYSYNEIAKMLQLTANTVGTYTKRIYEKLAVTSRAEAVFEAERLGIIQSPHS